MCASVCVRYRPVGPGASPLDMVGPRVSDAYQTRFAQGPVAGPRQAGDCVGVALHQTQLVSLVRLPPVTLRVQHGTSSPCQRHSTIRHPGVNRLYIIVLPTTQHGERQCSRYGHFKSASDRYLTSHRPAGRTVARSECVGSGLRSQCCIATLGLIRRM